MSIERTSRPDPIDVQGEVVWDDMQVSLSSARVPAASAPTWREHDFGVGGGVDYNVFGFAIGDYIDLYVQTSHSMKLDSVMDLHLHGTIPSDSTGDKIKWQLDVIAAGIGGAWAVPSGSPYTAEFTLDGTQAGNHNMFEIADLPAVNTTISSIYIGRLTRIAASSDDYAPEVYLVYADCHYQKDTIGSELELSKWR